MSIPDILPGAVGEAPSLMEWQQQQRGEIEERLEEGLSKEGLEGCLSKARKAVERCQKLIEERKI